MRGCKHIEEELPPNSGGDAPSNIKNAFQWGNPPVYLCRHNSQTTHSSQVTKHCPETWFIVNHQLVTFNSRSFWISRIVFFFSVFCWIAQRCRRALANVKWSTTVTPPPVFNKVVFPSKSFFCDGSRIVQDIVALKASFISVTSPLASYIFASIWTIMFVLMFPMLMWANEWLNGAWLAYFKADSVGNTCWSTQPGNLHFRSEGSSTGNCHWVSLAFETDLLILIDGQA